MHPYSSNANDKKFATSIIYVLSLCFAVAVTILLENFEKKVPSVKSFWVVAGPPSALAFFALFNWLYDNYIWKIFSGLPDLSGNWEGCLKSSHKDTELKNLKMVGIYSN